MTEQAGHRTPRRNPLRSVGRVLDTIDPLLDLLGVLAAVVLAGGLMVAALTGHHVGVL
jgi:hypothetical protein